MVQLLRRLLETQIAVRQKAPPDIKEIEIITLKELSEIRRIWLEEKHEFDDFLPRIYYEITGEIFHDPRPGAGNSLLGIDEWSVLEEICEEPAHMELLTKLLDVERQYKTMSRRIGIIDSLEQCFETSSRSKQEAMDNAHYSWDLKNAAQKGDLELVKQLSSEGILSQHGRATGATSGETWNSAQSLSEARALCWAELKFKAQQ